MQFAISLPWWTLLLLAVAIGAVAWGAYAELLVPLSRARRIALSALRAATLFLLVGALLRPVRVMPPDEASDAIVPVLVDASRSMRLADAGGRTRMDAADALLKDRVAPALQGRFATEIWTFGDTLTRASGEYTATAPRSDFGQALRGIRERYRERRVAGIVVISDGGDTGAEDPATIAEDGGTPVYSIGVGTPQGGPDYEVLDVAAGEVALAESSVDLTVSAVSRGEGGAFDVHVLENGRPIDLRRITAEADSPVRMVFTVSPSRDAATLYTVEIPSPSGEIVAENNRRSVLVGPPGRRRKLLVVEGAPGFEHTFLKRALAADAGIEVDSVVRKGRNEQGDATYFVQASASRASYLANGFPAEREQLYQYDAVLLANIEPDSLTRAQLEMVAEFVSERGGGLLVLGAKSFERQGLVGTALEEVLPVDLTDRGGGVVRTAAGAPEPHKLALTGDGATHPVMRIAGTIEESARRWSLVPALATTTPLGPQRPGAQVLAVTAARDGMRPVLAVQRYGRGRSMVFAGEASWRWRMQLPSTDRTHELFWRQVARWLASSAPDPVLVSRLDRVVPGTSEVVAVDVRDAAFRPVADAQVTMRVALPGGETRDLRPTLADPKAGRYAADLRFDTPGAYKVSAEARRGAAVLGTDERWVLAGAADLEMADPRLNEDVLRRVSRASGGAYLLPRDLASLPSLLAGAQRDPGPPRVQDIWHNLWIFVALVALLAAEWVLRRQWGLR